MEPATFFNASGHPIVLDDGSMVEADAWVDLKPVKHNDKDEIVSGNAGDLAEAAVEAGHLIQTKKASKPKPAPTPGSNE